MTNTGLQKPMENTRFNACPRCERKGLYQIKETYFRCRYCGTYIISADKKSG